MDRMPCTESRWWAWRERAARIVVAGVTLYLTGHLIHFALRQIGG